MNMRVAKEEIALMMPISLSRYADEPRFAEQPVRKGVLDYVMQAVCYVRDLPLRHATMLEMADMSDRELADIGIQRNEVERVFDAEFVAARRPLGGVAL
jgi:uncharacterized protein YjiS (DUF1127 family)